MPSRLRSDRCDKSPDDDRHRIARLVTPNVLSLTHRDRLLDGELYASSTRLDWRTHLKRTFDIEAESEKLLKMEERLSARVVGQNEAVRAVSKAVRRGRVGLRDPGKPIGSFLYLGPSGVGKTELAKALAEFLFDDEQSMTRIDMSDLRELVRCESHGLSDLRELVPGPPSHEFSQTITNAYDYFAGA